MNKDDINVEELFEKNRIRVALKEDVVNHFRKNWLGECGIVKFEDALDYNHPEDSEIIEIIETDNFKSDYRALLEEVVECTAQKIFEHIILNSKRQDIEDLKSLIDYLKFTQDEYVLLFHAAHTLDVKRTGLPSEAHKNIKMQCYYSEKTCNAIAIPLLKSSISTYTCNVFFSELEKKFYLQIWKSKR